MSQTSSTTSKLTRAVKHHQAGDLPQAERLYKKVLSRSPNQVDALHLTGVIAYQTGRHERAARYVAKAIAINPAVADFHLTLGNIFQATGQYKRAVVEYKTTLELNPRQPMAFNNMANTLMALDRHQDAAEILERTVLVYPDMAVLYHTLGMAYRELEKYDLALEKFETALRLNPSLLETWVNIGDVYHKLGRIEDATASFDRAMSMDPNRFETHFNLANVLQESGEFDRSIGCYDTALKLNPRHVKSVCNLVQARKYDSIDHPDRESIAGLIDNPDVPPRDQTHLHFAMAKLLNDCGDYDSAFLHYQKGNVLAQVRFDGKKHEQYIRDLKTTYSGEYFKRKTGLGVESARPVFIVGMPRSGTTLVEQILSSHPLVAGAGELPDIPWLVRRLPADLGSSKVYPECVEDVDKDSAERLAGRYLKRLDLVSSTADRVTDKLPTNYLHLGLIVVLFPNSTIIHCKRDPMDTCLSCYFQNFSRDLGFCFDLEDLGFYYRQYERLMAHWLTVLPLSIHEVTYEDLIENPEDVSHGLVAAAGMEWDAICLSPHKNRRPVKTASSWQVRQPLYKTSVARWKRYEKHLDPLKSSLGLEEETLV